MRIAILGATGLIGHHTARAVMAAGHELTVLHREHANLQQLSVQPHRTAVFDTANVEQMAHALLHQDAVIHCAGYYPTIPRRWQQDVVLANNALERFYQACERACYHADLRKIVYTGASIALRSAEAGKLGDERCEYDAQPTSKNPYVQCKWAMQTLSLARAQRGLPISIGIPSMTFGEYDMGPSTGQLITRLANGELSAYVHGKRNAIYAGDAGRGLLRVTEAGRVGQTYLLTGFNTDMQSLVKMMAESSGRPEPKAVPLWVAKALNYGQSLAYQITRKPPTVSATAIAVMSAGQHLSGAKAKAELDFEAQVLLPHAIQLAYDWFVQAGYIHSTLDQN